MLVEVFSPLFIEEIKGATTILFLGPSGDQIMERNWPLKSFGPLKSNSSLTFGIWFVFRKSIIKTLRVELDFENKVKRLLISGL